MSLRVPLGAQACHPHLVGAQVGHAQVHCREVTHTHRVSFYSPPPTETECSGRSPAGRSVSSLSAGPSAEASVQHLTALAVSFTCCRAPPTPWDPSGPVSLDSPLQLHISLHLSSSFQVYSSSFQVYSSSSPSLCPACPSNHPQSAQSSCRRRKRHACWGVRRTLTWRAATHREGDGKKALRIRTVVFCPSLWPSGDQTPQVPTRRLHHKAVCDAGEQNSSRLSDDYTREAAIDRGGAAGIQRASRGDFAASTVQFRAVV